MADNIANHQELHHPATVLRDATRSEYFSLCDTCSRKEATFCRLLRAAAARPLTQSYERARRREILCEGDKPPEKVSVLSDGWAFRFRRFRDGRRHILHFLIPGDVIQGAFIEGHGFSVQALTDVRCCKFALPK